MKHIEILSTLKQFDNEVYERLQEVIENQHYTLSLVPTMNAESPFSAYLEGSVLINCDRDSHRSQVDNGFEKLAVERCQELFNAEHAIVRLGNLKAASRMVLQAVLKNVDRILSFNGRKAEHCDGLNYSFASFSITADTQDIDWQDLAEKIKSWQPKIVIFSPTSYPRLADYERMAQLARAGGALFWVDIGQNAGLVAAKLLPNPTKNADIVTFSTNDALQGPDGAVILCRKALQADIDKVLLHSGYADVKQNRLAALAVTLGEAAGSSFAAYGKAVLKNAAIMAQELKARGIPILCGGTDTHLILAGFPLAITLEQMNQRLLKAGFDTKGAVIPTSDSNSCFHALRLSSLNPTTRSLNEQDMKIISQYLAAALKTTDEVKLKKISDDIRILVMDKPIFSEKWLPKVQAADTFFNGADNNNVHKVAAQEKKNIIQKLFHH